ncbi:MAG: UDP-3-O-acyl-N-acetylglucosamine deacetylase [Bacteroidales bacterium]|nr:UDP-3-O-acyl-N-acetylglucosamine deacetylase [Bacteroidales bacterium]
MRQYTLKRKYCFEGKGLHTGAFSRIVVNPAEENTGIVFLRTDLGVRIPASAANVGPTMRSTTICSGDASVTTIEHIMSALTGLGVDNALIETDSAEMPILDGSAAPYVAAFASDGLQEQDAERRFVEISSEFEIRDEESGSWIRVTPADSLSFDVTVDFSSRVLGIQKVSWQEGEDYAREIAPSRTFCFFHELEYLASQGLVKGGDVDNAIVVVERPASREQVDGISRLFNREAVDVNGEGYLNNVELHFPDECGRHKLLDLIGDIRLSGGFPKARITAYKPGHKLNTMAAKAILNQNING